MATFLVRYFVAAVACWQHASAAPIPSSAVVSMNCSATAQHDAISHGIIVPPIPNATVASCCAACEANSRCEAFVTGPCSAVDPVCKHWPDPTVDTCFLVSGFQGLKPSPDRTTGHIRTAPPAPAPPPPTPPGVTAGWGAGWGFKTHGGTPAMPAKFQSRYLLNQSVVGYFVANNTGLANDAELAAEARLGIMGIGWNLNHLATSKHGGLESYEVEQAGALKKLRPDVGVMVLRNTEVVSTFWTAFREAENNTELWLQRPPGSGKPISEPWGTDDPHSGGPTPKYFLNFSNQATRSWWLEKYVAPALDQPDIDGVYTDCSCGNARGYHPTLAEWEGRQQAFDAALDLARSKGKWFSAWTGAAVTRPPKGVNDCAPTMARLLQEGANNSHTMQLYTGFNVPATTLAAFLIARGDSAVITLQPYDRPMSKTPFSFEAVDLNADPGTPLGPGKVDASGKVFTRAYTKANVRLDCSTFKANISFSE